MCILRKKLRKKNMAYEIRIRLDQPLITAALVFVFCSFAGVGVYFDKIKASDIAIIIATIMGPVVAVQIQAFREERRKSLEDERVRIAEVQTRQKWAFRQMMAYRSNPIDYNFIQAFCVVPLDFQGNDKVIAAWKSYFAHLGSNYAPDDTVANEKTNDLRADLLLAMGVSLGYSFTTQELKNESYMPKGHVDLGKVQAEILNNLHAILSDKKALTVLALTKPLQSPAMPAENPTPPAP